MAACIGATVLPPTHPPVSLHQILHINHKHLGGRRAAACEAALLPGLGLHTRLPMHKEDVPAGQRVNPAQEHQEGQDKGGCRKRVRGSAADGGSDRVCLPGAQGNERAVGLLLARMRAHKRNIMPSAPLLQMLQGCQVFANRQASPPNVFHAHRFRQRHLVPAASVVGRHVDGFGGALQLVGSHCNQAARVAKLVDGCSCRGNTHGAVVSALKNEYCAPAGSPEPRCSQTPLCLVASLMLHAVQHASRAAPCRACAPRPKSCQHSPT